MDDLGRGLSQFENRVFVILEMCVVDNDGQAVCQIKGHTNDPDSPKQAISDILNGLVDDWAKLYNGLIAIIRECSFGNLDGVTLERLRAAHRAGTMLLTLTKLPHQEDLTETEFSNRIIDLAASVRALSILEKSYVSNPSDEELDIIADREQLIA